MALRYDFDMVFVRPNTDQDAVAGLLKDIGGPPTMAEPQAQFRDPATVAALRRADPVVRDFFIASGFGLGHYDSGAPAGHFPAQDEPARAAVIERLAVNLPQFPLKEANWGGFEFNAFLQALSQATPVTMPAAATPRSSPPKAKHWDVGSFEPQSRPAPISDEDIRGLAEARKEAQRAKGRRMLAISVLISGIVLLLFVAVQLIG